MAMHRAAHELRQVLHSGKAYFAIGDEGVWNIVDLLGLSMVCLKASQLLAWCSQTSVPVHADTDKPGPGAASVAPRGRRSRPSPRPPG